MEMMVYIKVPLDITYSLLPPESTRLVRAELVFGKMENSRLYTALR